MDQVKARTRTTLIVAAPLVAVATLALGLRVGAGSAFKAALVYGAPPGRAFADSGERPYSFQITTYLEDRGVREAIALKDLTVVGRHVYANGDPVSGAKESRWTGASNHDGIAEVALSFPGEPHYIRLEVMLAGDREPLAVGLVALDGAGRPPRRPSEFWEDAARVRPSKNEGNIETNVFIEGGRLVVGAPTSVWVEVDVPEADPWPDRDEPRFPVYDTKAEVTVHASPEMGVRFEEETATNAKDPSAWIELRATALGQAASTAIEVKAKDGRHTTWFGTLPTAPGAFSIQLPHEIFPGDPEVSALIVAPNPRTVVYVELDDRSGRVAAAALPLAVEPGEPLPVARFPIPKTLAPGWYWLVASGDPRGAEKLSGATILRAFMVRPPGSQRRPGHERLAAIQATRNSGAVDFPRWLAIDGIATRGAQNRARHRRGLFIGLFALGAAAILEVLLLSAAAREAKLVLAQAENENPERVTAKPPGGGVVVALLVAVLGFAFLAALIVAKA